MSANPNQPQLPSLATPSNHNAPRRSRPRVREVSSRFMSPATPNPKQQPPSTPSHSKIHTLRRSHTDLRYRFSDENRPGSVNRRSVSPVRSSKPRSAVRLFKEVSRHDTPKPIPGRILRQLSWDSDASRLVRGFNVSGSLDDSSDDNASSIDGDCESVMSEPCEIGNSRFSMSSSMSMDLPFSSEGVNVKDNVNSKSMEVTQSTGNSRGSTPFSKSMEAPLSRNGQGKSVNVNEMSGIKGLSFATRGLVKVGRSLNLPPTVPLPGWGKGHGTMEVKKTVKKGSREIEDVHRFRLLHNSYLQWRYANAKAQVSIAARKKRCEIQLYSLGVKISELRDSVKSKRMEYGFLKALRSSSTIVDAQMPYLDEWSILEESYSSSLLELSDGLLNALSQLPLVGNVTADVQEIDEALHSAMKTVEMISLNVQSFMPKAEHLDTYISDLARVYNGEITLVDECGDLLSKAHLSQIEECSLRGQLIQLHNLKLDGLKDGQHKFGR